MEDVIQTIVDLDILDNSIIKVIGVGGGGCNAVNYMYRQGIKDVSFLVCNTDSMALQKMSVPAKLQLGTGLGAGGRPEKAEEFALASEDRIREALSDGTKMVFITAGMGGGTGTGASPVVARIAQEMGILTVGIVTIPFAFEGKRVIRKAMCGVAKLAKYTDALLVINNERLKLLFPDFDLPNAFRKADEVVSNAAKSIAEIITIPGYINIDFQDVYNTLKDGDMAIMNVGIANGERRITDAIQNALNSPLVNTNDVHGASRILLNFYCSEKQAILSQELEQVTEFCDSVGEDVDVRWGMNYDNSLDDSVKVTIIATGYKVNDLPGLEEAVQTDQPEVIVKNEASLSVEDAMKKFYQSPNEKEDDTPQTTDNENDDAEIEVEPTQEEVNDDNNLEVIEIDDVKTHQQSAPAQSTPSKTVADNLNDEVIEIEDEQQKTNNEYVPAWQRWMKRRNN